MGARAALPVARLSQGLALALCAGFGLALIAANVPSWDLEDADAYWNAALRLRDGSDLYPAVADANAAGVYRYAPWFAWSWVPLTLLPKGAVMAGWSVILALSVAAALVPLVRHRSVAALCLAAALGGLLVRTASTGNVHALLIAGLVHGIQGRGGPVWIGVSASLKIVPIGYALVYVGRREWRKAVIAVAVTVLLAAPALFYDLSHYPADLGRSFSLLSIAGPAPWVLAALVFAGLAITLARGRKRWVAATGAVLAASPRLALYDATYLLVGLGRRRDDA